MNLRLMHEPNTLHDSQTPVRRQDASSLSGLYGVKRVVIAGGGLAGLAAAKAMLKKNRHHVSVTIVDMQPEYVFKPMLYEWLNGRDVTMNRTAYFSAKGHAVRYIQGKALRIAPDPESPGKEMLVTSQGDLPFDYLIVATGSRTNYFGTPGAEANTLPMLTPQDMQRFEQSMLDKLERAQAAVMSGNSEQARECLAFHIIGGGLSGVELAFELSTRLAELIPNQYPALSGIQPAISLIEANPTILPACTPFEQKFIARKLERKGVRLYLGYRVTEVTPTQLILNSQSDSSLTLPAVDALWVAGMKANLPEGFWGEQSQADVYPGSNRVKVNAYLEVPERPNIYVIGDASGGLNTKTGKLFPVTGQIAAQQAQYVARDISLKLHGKFRKRSGFIQLDKGHMVSMGPGKASMTLDFLPKPLDQLTFYGPLVAWFRHTYYGLLMRR